jgi:hypothetical protein
MPSGKVLDGGWTRSSVVPEREGPDIVDGTRAYHDRTNIARRRLGPSSVPRDSTGINPVNHSLC